MALDDGEAVILKEWTDRDRERDGERVFSSRLQEFPPPPGVGAIKIPLFPNFYLVDYRRKRTDPLGPD